MSLSQRLAAEVEYALDGEPWHGPSVLAILKGLDAESAARKPMPSAHSAWELVLHITAWTREVTRRARGGPAGEPPEGDWPVVGEVTSKAWEAAVADLRATHADLASATRALADQDLDRRIAGSALDDNGAEVTVYRTVAGLLQHDAYHSAQIVMLRKLLSPRDTV